MRRLIWVALVAVGLAAIAVAVVSVNHLPAHTRDVAKSYPSTTPVKAVARHLDRDYVAPRRDANKGAGVLEIRSLGIRAPVAKVGLDSQTMAIPNDPADVGWLDSSATSFDLAGVSLISGHVSSRSDSPGALFKLAEVSEGAEVVWHPAEGGSVTFRVTGKATYPRAEGVPAETVARDGRHRLALVTCTDRVEVGGRFRYLGNLVVSAVEVARSTT